MSQKTSGLWGRLRSAFIHAPQRSAQVQESIIIVSGLPRSGTSMMMKMLEAGGLPPLTDEIREADADNPKGYYEFERVKRLNKGDTAWLPEAKGKTVKVIAALMEYLPADHNYQVIFMRRAMEEVLRSQKQMLIRRGEPTDKVDDKEMAELFRKHLDNVTSWMAEQPNFQVIFVSYNDVLEHPQEEAEKVNRFLGNTLDVAKMVGVIDSSLYRQRT
jgi:hypothetical protein